MITGKTELLCIVADPISHVKTPEAFNRFLETIGVDAVLIPAHVRADDLREVIGGLRRLNNLRGIVVTIPHKIAAAELCDELHDSAVLVGAVNVIRRESDGRLIGGNFDGSGFVSALEAEVGHIAGRSVYVAGAGGAARAIAFAIARGGASRLAIYNRTSARADALTGALAESFRDLAVSSATSRPADFDIAINATSLGLDERDPLPFGVDDLPPHAVVAEVIMQPSITPLLRAARARQLRVVTGNAMLDAQFDSWIAFLSASAANS